MIYTAAAEWDGRECKLEDTLFGADSSVTYGGTPILNDAKLVFANVVTIPSKPLSGRYLKTFCAEFTVVSPCLFPTQKQGLNFHKFQCMHLYKCLEPLVTEKKN